MEYRNDLAAILLNGLPDDERSHVIATINQEDAEKLRRKRASGAEEGMVVGNEFGAEDDDLADEMAIKVRVPEQG